jgi:hypothetical protein
MFKNIIDYSTKIYTGLILSEESPRKPRHSTENAVLGPNRSPK